MNTTRDELREVAGLVADEECFTCDDEAREVARGALDLLDQLDQQERELDYWMTRAYEAEGKLWQAEARIKAVEDELLAVEGDYGPYGALRLGVVRRIRRALIQ